MKKLTLLVVTLTILAGAFAQAQDIAGTWQGTLQAGKGLRTVLKITKTNDGGWSAMFYSIDQGPDGMTIPSITLHESTVKFSMPAINGSYEGRLSSDGASITGTWTKTTRHILWTSSERQRRPSGKLTRPHTPCSSSWLIPTSNWRCP